MISKSWLSLMATCFLFACAHKPQLTLEQLDVQIANNKKSATRLYKGKTIDQVRSASRNVLYLLDPPDMQLDVPENELLATRFSTFYAVFSVGYGRDWYSVTMKKTPDGVESKFGLADQMNVGPFPSFIQPSFRSNIPVSAHDNPVDFKLFHDRVEYVLGIGSVWPTCEQAKKESPDKDIRLCDSIGLENLPPNDLSNQPNSGSKATKE